MRLVPQAALWQVSSPVPARPARASPGCCALSGAGNRSALSRGHHGPLLHLPPPHHPPAVASSAAPAAAEPAAPTSSGGSAARPDALPEWGDSKHETSKGFPAPQHHTIQPSPPGSSPTSCSCPSCEATTPFSLPVVAFLSAGYISPCIPEPCVCRVFWETHSLLLEAPKLLEWMSTVLGHPLHSLLHLPWWCQGVEVGPGSPARTGTAPGPGTAVGFPLLQGCASAYLQWEPVAEGS